MVKIFVGNVNEESKSADLRLKFEKFGQVDECDIVKKYAFVHMPNEEEAKKAIASLDGSELDGQKLGVELSTSGGSKGGGGRSSGGGGGRGRFGGGGRGRDGGRDGGRGRDDRGRDGGRDSRYDPYSRSERPPMRRDPFDYPPRRPMMSRDPYLRDSYDRLSRDPYDLPPRDMLPPRRDVIDDRYERALPSPYDRPPRDLYDPPPPRSYERLPLPHDPYERALPPRDPYERALPPRDPYERAPPREHYSRPPPEYYESEPRGLSPDPYAARRAPYDEVKSNGYGPPPPRSNPAPPRSNPAPPMTNGGGGGGAHNGSVSRIGRF